ncbi:MAG: phenylalanine--tRNA ligase subunit beta [Pseudomonadota bacterium]|nr:MAG: phenylalanine--tRNA ligase subunit beta [Pseudomonadota bacterium]
MKISHRWLSEWVENDLDAQSLAEQFTLCGLEVDAVEPVAPALDGVVVGEIIAVEPHPDADRLRICRVVGDSQERTVVCGAPNARAGLKAPLATLGACLPGGLKIKPARLRGVASEGMLCSGPELGLAEDADGLMELPGDAPVGQALSEYLQLDDHVLEIDLTPNRADCLSVRGLARELGAITNRAVQAPSIEPVAATSGARLEIELEAPRDCPRYAGRVIEGIDPTAATPIWLVERLRRAGLRSLGPTVDVTNYVLLELGQPMHAFDLARLSERIRVRRAQSGDRIRLLDGQVIEPDEDMLLIADADKPVALAGIMGGLDTAVSDTTRDILLESAWFHPATISGRARRLGLATESAHRFERGVDPELQRLAVERATRLIVDIAGGRPGPVVEAIARAELPSRPKVALRIERLNRVLGSTLGEAEVIDILQRLEMEVSSSSGELSVVPPSARRDIEIEADLIEEVARIYGYDRLPVSPPGGRLHARVGSESRLPERRLRDQLIARGFQEIMTWSFVGRDELDRIGLAGAAQPLANPLSRDMAVLRTSLLPGLLATADTNFRRQHLGFRLFECGTCFERDDDRFRETWRIGLLMTGRIGNEHFSGRPRWLDFFDLKGEIEHLLALNQVTGQVSVAPADKSFLHPGQGAALLLDERPAGWFGQLHPKLQRDLEFDQPVFVAELDGAEISQVRLPEHRLAGRYPAVRRDIAVIVDDRYSAADVLAEVRRCAGALLENCVIFDQYRGKGVESGCRSLAIGLILRDVSRTLQDREVDSLVDEVVAALKARFNAKLRG